MPQTPAANPALPSIHPVRGQRVMLDSDLARLYEVPTKVFNQTIQRNADRFPADFVFQLTREEVANLKSQIVTSSSPSNPPTFGGYGGARKLPFVFTEHGAIMAATILRSPRAVVMSVYVVRAFVRMREDKKLLEHDLVLQDVVEKLLPLLDPPAEKQKPFIGFQPGKR
jgi:hypothetical protein